MNEHEVENNNGKNFALLLCCSRSQTLKSRIAGYLMLVLLSTSPYQESAFIRMGLCGGK